MALVVVGVDGSEGSQPALRFAAEEAALRNARLLVVCAWEVPSSLYAGLLSDDVVIAAENSAKDIAAKALSQVVHLQPGIDREAGTPRGPAAEVLVRESADADLLVIGSSGHSGFAKLLPRSVSQQCAQHASCPVAIVPQQAGET